MFVALLLEDKATGSSLNTSAEQLTMSDSLKSELELRGCVSPSCVRTLILHVFEAPPGNTTAAAEIGNYRRVTRLAIGDDTTSVTNITRVINFESEENGFYLAVQDEGTCVGISRLLVFYNVCPEEVEDLVLRPETISPPIVRLNRPLEVRAGCVEGAEPQDRNGSAVRVSCNQGGVWFPVPGFGCQCRQGLQESADGRSCINGKKIYYSPGWEALLHSMSILSRNQTTHLLVASSKRSLSQTSFQRDPPST